MEYPRIKAIPENETKGGHYYEIRCY